MAASGMVSIGLAATLGAEFIAQLAPAIERAGFHALWVNDTPGADALGVLEAVAGVTSQLTLAAGVLPVDRRSASSIASDVAARSLPQDRLVLGIGSGSAGAGSLALVGDAVAVLAGALEVRIVVGALGPKMRRLAVERAGGPLLSWLTPEAAGEQAAQARAVAPDTHITLYVRTALDPAAAGRMTTEMRRYGSIPSYAANFARNDMRVEDTVLDPTVRPVADRLDAYRATVDEVVLRAITPADELDDYLDFIRTAAALL